MTKVELASKPYAPEFILDDSEEIIGIYGSKDSHAEFASLGFIVWKPPHF